MKRHFLMGLLLSAAVLTPVRGRTATAPGTNAPPTIAPGPTDSAQGLSTPAGEVAKMASAGIPEDVLKAYVENSKHTFGLTADAIVKLHELGVSSPVLAAMLTHDRALLDAAYAQPPYTPSPAVQTVAAQPDMTGAAAAPYPGTLVPEVNYYNNSYSELSPYGYWSDLPDYGWCWQPYAYLGYSYPYVEFGFPFLGTGRWLHHPTRGWVWCPPVSRAPFRAALRGQANFAGAPRAIASAPFRSGAFGQPFRTSSSVSVARIGGGFRAPQSFAPAIRSPSFRAPSVRAPTFRAPSGGFMGSRAPVRSGGFSGFGGHGGRR